jgi:hypothetical protein
MVFLCMPEPKSTSETKLFGVPALRAKAGTEGQWGFAYIGIKDDQFLMLIMSAKSEQALDTFAPTWAKMLESIKPAEE